LSSIQKRSLVTKRTYYHRRKRDIPARERGKSRTHTGRMAKTYNKGAGLWKNGPHAWENRNVISGEKTL